MSYERKLAILSAVVVVLGIIYGTTLVSESLRNSEQSAAMSWLTAEQASRAGRIHISDGSGVAADLIRSGDLWYLDRSGKRYPVRQEKIADLLAALSKRAVYPRRANTTAAHQKLGLADDAASRVAVYGDPAAAPLLTLLVGNRDASGQAVYLRRSGDSEARSGRDIFSAYTAAGEKGWLDLRVFPKSGAEALRPESVQRILVKGEGAAGSYILSRGGAASWIVDGSVKADTARVDAYLRAVGDLEGEDLAEPEGANFVQSASVVLELGDGRTRTLLLGPEQPEGRRDVRVDGSSLVYRLTTWSAQRLLRERSYFLVDH